jgi:hypothetical protein
MFGKKKKDQDLFINPEELTDSTSDELYDDQFLLEDEVEDLSEGLDLDDSTQSDESDEDDEARYQQHLKLRKEDKIFNNAWNNGEGITDDSYANISIKLDPGHSDSNLLDSTKVDHYLDKSIIERDLIQIVKEDQELCKIMESTEESRKYSKVELNLIFSKLCKLVEVSGKSTFITPIDVLDFVSMLSQMDYKRLFESLEYEHKEVLLVELDKKFGILEGKVKFKKLF